MGVSRAMLQEWKGVGSFGCARLYARHFVRLCELHGSHGLTVRTTFGLRLFSKELLLFFDELLN